MRRRSESPPERRFLQSGEVAVTTGATQSFVRVFKLFLSLMSNTCRRRFTTVRHS
jgi:hypothetical protein